MFGGNVPQIGSAQSTISSLGQQGMMLDPRQQMQLQQQFANQQALAQQQAAQGNLVFGANVAAQAANNAAVRQQALAAQAQNAQLVGQQLNNLAAMRGQSAQAINSALGLGTALG